MALIISGSAVTKRFKTEAAAITFLNSLGLEDCEQVEYVNDHGQKVIKLVEDDTVWACAVVVGE